jgi:hypothetical protein
VILQNVSVADSGDAVARGFYAPVESLLDSLRQVSVISASDWPRGVHHILNEAIEVASMGGPDPELIQDFFASLAGLGCVLGLFCIGLIGHSGSLRRANGVK